MKKFSLMMIAVLVASLGVAGGVAAKPGKGQHKAHAVRGIVDSVGTDSITLKHKDGSTLTIAVTSDTKIRVNGAPGVLSDIQPGFRAEVRRNSDGSARAIIAKDPAFKPVVHGVVDAVGSDSITLKLRNGDLLTMAVTSDTKIHLKCGPGSLSDIEVGFRAHVKRNSDGSARRIQAVQPHFKCVVHGTVSAVGSDSLTLTHPNGFTLAIGVTADTKIFVNGAAASLADIQIGYRATVRRNNDGTARRINAHAPE